MSQWFESCGNKVLHCRDTGTTASYTYCTAYGAGQADEIARLLNEKHASKLPDRRERVAKWLAKVSESGWSTLSAADAVIAKLEKATMVVLNEQHIDWREKRPAIARRIVDEIIAEDM